MRWCIEFLFWGFFTVLLAINASDAYAKQDWVLFFFAMFGLGLTTGRTGKSWKRMWGES